MAALCHAILPDRTVIAVTGADAEDFLQGLITNDVSRVTGGGAIYAALLTPQGKYLFDFFVLSGDTGFLLDCEAERTEALLKRLRMYKLRAKVELADRSDTLAVAAVFGDGAAGACGLDAAPGSTTAFAGGTAFVDPRLAAAGIRIVAPVSGLATTLAATGGAAVSAGAYDRLRLSLGLPEGSRDLIVDKTVLLEANFEQLNGVDFQKGCYVGQEVTARTKYRGLVRRRLYPVRIEGPTPEPGTPVTLDGKEAGTLRSARDGVGLALLRLDRLEDGDATLTAGEARLLPQTPDWLHTA